MRRPMLDKLPQSDADRALSDFLLSVLPAVAEQLARSTWDGFAIAEPAAPQVNRARLVHQARLRVTAQREYRVSAVGQETAPHDHRHRGEKSAR